MKFVRINHIGIASRDLGEVMTRMASLFDQTPSHQEEVKDQKLKRHSFLRVSLA